MFFSVSIPVYNAGKYIDRAIESVINQSERDFELILVDDGSTDNSLSICRKWESRYPNMIRVVEKENTGSLMTRRRCIYESKGEYLYIIDADDFIIDKDALKKIRIAIEKNGCDMVFFNCTTDNKNKFFQFPFHDGDIFENESLYDIYRYIFLDIGLNQLWNKVFSRDLVDWDSDYETFKDLSNGTDLFQSIPIISNAKKITFMDEILYFYRKNQNNSSIIHVYKASTYDALKINFYRLKEFSATWSLSHCEREKLLRINAMRAVTTSAYKVRLLRKQDKVLAYEYIRKIGEDTFFAEYYTLRGVPVKRSIIIIFLKLKAYRVLSELFLSMSKY